MNVALRCYNISKLQISINKETHMNNVMEIFIIDIICRMFFFVYC